MTDIATHSRLPTPPPSCPPADGATVALRRTGPVALRWLLRSSIPLISACLALLVAIELAKLSFWLNTQNNDFPAFYHPDEGTKVGQLMTRRAEPFNFNHPLLLLRLTQWYLEHYTIPHRFWDILTAGRTVSAILGSLTVLALSLAGYTWRGWAGLLLCGSAVALCPSLLVFSHYFKEEPALVCGLAISIWGAALCLCSPGGWRAWVGVVILGAGCAICTSGKYVGVTVCVPALVAVVLADKSRWYFLSLRLLLLAAVAVPLFVCINAPGFEDPWTLKVNDDVEHHIGEEFEHATSGHGIASLNRPNRLYLQTAISETMPMLWVLAGIGAVGWITRPRLSRWGVVMAIFLIVFIVVLAWGAIPIRRYALPITLMFYFTSAGIFAVFVARFRNLGVRIAGVTVALVAIAAPQWAKCQTYDDYFLHDSRQRLHDWVAVNLPRDASILCEAYTSLDDGGDDARFPRQARVSQSIDRVMFIPEAGSIDDMARRGIQYVVLSEPAYERYFLIDAAPIEHAEQEYERYRRIYEDVFNRCELVYEDKADPESMSYVNPHISVYKLPVPQGGVRPVQRRRWLPF